MSRYSYELMAKAEGGEALDRGDLPAARDRRDAQDLATKAYETARFQAASNTPPLPFPRAVVVHEDGAEVWRATEADLPDAEHDMDV